MGAQPDYSRAALARFIEFVVAKGLVHPATAQGWRVATAKVLEELTPAEAADVRRIDVEADLQGIPQPVSGSALARLGGRVSPAGGPGDRGVRALDGGSGELRVPVAAARAARADGSAAAADGAPAGALPGPAARPRAERPRPAPARTDIALEYPLRPDLLAQVVVPRDLTVEEARRMGAFLVTLAVDFKPVPSGERPAPARPRWQLRHAALAPPARQRSRTEQAGHEGAARSLRSPRLRLPPPHRQRHVVAAEPERVRQRHVHPPLDLVVRGASRDRTRGRA